MRALPMAASTADLHLLHKSYMKTSVTASLLQVMFQISTMQLFFKKDFDQILSCEICEFFKKSNLIEHIQATASGNKCS